MKMENPQTRCEVNRLKILTLPGLRHTTIALNHWGLGIQ